MATTKVTSSETSEDTKTLITVLLLIFAYPVGIILTWFWTNWPKWVKFLLTIPLVLAILIIGLMMLSLASLGIILSQNPNLFDNMANQVDQTENLRPETRALISSSMDNLEKANEIAGYKTLTATQKNQLTSYISSAIADAKQATELEPEASETWANLGKVYNALGVVQGSEDFAISSYKKAIELEPDYYLYHEDLGGIYLAMANKTSEAVEEFQEVVRLEPNYANGYYNLGIAYKKLGAKNEARKAFEKTLDVLPDDSPDRYKADMELENL